MENKKGISFLELLADYIVENYSNDMADLCIVMPNKRAGLFLQTYLGKKIGKAAWSPHIFSSEDFISKLSGLYVKDPLSLLFEFYDVYKSIEGNNAQPFDSFINWAPALLSDLSEIDLYLVDAKDIFNHLSQVKQLENWDIGGDNAGQIQTQYLEFFSSLGKFYEHFRNQLLVKNQAWTGMAYREVAENLEERWTASGFGKAIFAGFNALNKAEESIFKQLVSESKAEVLIDGDTYYTENPSQEAGYFIRNLKQEKEIFPDRENLKWEFSNYKEGEKTIEIIATAGNANQAKIAGDILAKSKAAPDFKSWALVLADENLMLPVLHSLPDNINQANVTMGYPLRNTPIASIISNLFTLHENAYKLRQGDGPIRFYHNDIIQLFRHPYVQLLLVNDGKTSISQTLVRKITASNKVFYTIEELKALPNETSPHLVKTLDILFGDWQEQPTKAINCLQSLVQLLKDMFASDALLKEKEHVPIEIEFLFILHKINHQLEDLLEVNPLPLSIKALRMIYNQLIRLSAVPFYGEPLQGLQIMGMLETRNLDFENVILLSVSEGFLPANSKLTSFLPFELKRAFGLPVYKDRDAIYAYHFYRLLQRAKNVYLVYNSETDDFGAGEKSRFITQIAKELPQVNPNIRISEKVATIIPTTGAQDTEISIPKSGEIIEVLKQRAQKSYSPSALNVYRNCSLQFYYKYIIGLSEIEEVEETVAAHTFGTILHNSIEELYKEFTGTLLKKELLQQVKKNIEPVVRQVFIEVHNSDQLEYGKNLLTLKVAIRYLERFIELEIKRLQSGEIELISQEEPLERNLEIQLPETGGKLTILLRGKADRIERENGQLMIIDYKTGQVDGWELNVKDWESFHENTKLNKAFQLLLYAYMYKAKYEGSISSGIITFRDLVSGIKMVKMDRREAADVLSNEDMSTFESSLRLLLTQLYDPKVPFTQTEDIAVCSYCSFKDICNR